MDEKIAHAEVSGLVQPEIPNYLSNKGEKEFNEYTYCGSEVLFDWFNYPPRLLEIVFRAFKQEFEGAMKPEGSV